MKNSPLVNIKNPADIENNTRFKKELFFSAFNRDMKNKDNKKICNVI